MTHNNQYFVEKEFSRSFGLMFSCRKLNQTLNSIVSKKENNVNKKYFLLVHSSFFLNKQSHCCYSLLKAVMPEVIYNFACFIKKITKEN